MTAVEMLHSLMSSELLSLDARARARQSLAEAHGLRRCSAVLQLWLPEFKEACTGSKQLTLHL